MIQSCFYYRNLFFGGSNKKKSPSPQPRRRGSSGSDHIPTDSEIGGVSYHSYSTGNLRELDDKPKRSYRWVFSRFFFFLLLLFLFFLNDIEHIIYIVYQYIVALIRVLFFQQKSLNIFLIFPQKHMLWVLIRSVRF